MPLTPFQREVALLLAGQRSPDSHVGGGAVINRADDSPRYSADLDLFHDVAESVQTSAEADAAVLVSHGFEFAWLLRQPFLYRAQIRRQTDQLKLDWCHDSAFRFFPVQPDAGFGYCLHPADLATNKALALAGRAEVRDYLDILFLHETYLTLGAMCWAACGKDEGFTPTSILDMMKRHSRFRKKDLAGEHLVRPFKLKDLKQTWLQAVSEAEELFDELPAEDIGCLYLDSTGNPITPDPDRPEFGALIKHRGSVRGAWPDLCE